MLSRFFYSCCVDIRSGTRLRLLPVGGLLCISFAPSHSDKMIAIKQSNNALLSLSYNCLNVERNCIVVDCMPVARYSSWHMYRNTHHSACGISAALLFEYTSYSQTQWRYIRYLFGSIATEAFVQHTELLDIQVLNTHGLTHLKHTYVMFLRHFTTNISSYFFVSRYASSLLCMSRSRTIQNWCNAPVPALILTEVTDRCGTLCVTALDDDTEYYDELQSLDTYNMLSEQQVNVAGVLYTNHISSLSDMCVFTSFMYLSWYATVYKVIALACSLVLYSLSYLLLYMHIVVMLYHFLYLCNSTVLLASFRFSEYIEYAADPADTDTEDDEDYFEYFTYYDDEIHALLKQEAANISTVPILNDLCCIY